MIENDCVRRPVSFIDAERCVGCGDCLKYCPRGCLSLDRSRWVVVSDPSGCVGCRQCQRACSYHCITVRGPFLGLEDRAHGHDLPVAERVRDFSEVHGGFTLAEAVGEAVRCLRCPRPRCREVGCPAHNDIPAMNAAIRELDFLEALRILTRTSNLHAICSRVCDQSRLCEGACVHCREGGQAVAIGQLERFVGDWAREKGYVRTEPPPTPTGRRVAVVGSGPAGLSAAEDLVRCGHAVTVYEALPVAGGVMVWGIPDFILPSELVAAKLEELRTLGVQFRTGTRINLDYPIERLFQEGADVVFLAAGAEKDDYLELPGNRLAGITTASALLRGTKLALVLSREYALPAVGENVLVVGVNTVALHVARSARRLGALNVTVIDALPEKLVAASRGEMATAAAEGVNLRFEVAAISFSGREKVEEAELQCMQTGRGWWGKIRSRPRTGSNFNLPADTVVFATGFSISQEVLELAGKAGIDTDAYGTVVVMGENGRTSREKVWAAGDVVTGPRSVVGAMAAGKKAARHIDQTLRWRNLFAHEGGVSSKRLRPLKGERRPPDRPVGPWREEP